MQDYYSQDYYLQDSYLRMSFVANSMTRRHFEIIRQMLHFADNKQYIVDIANDIRGDVNKSVHSQR